MPPVVHAHRRMGRGTNTMHPVAVAVTTAHRRIHITAEQWKQFEVTVCMDNDKHYDVCTTPVIEMIEVLMGMSDIIVKGVLR